MPIPKRQDIDASKKWSPPYWPIALISVLFLISALCAIVNIVVGTVIGAASLCISLISFEIWRHRNPVLDTKDNRAAERFYFESVKALKILGIMFVIFLATGITLLLLAAFNVI